MAHRKGGFEARTAKRRKEILLAERIDFLKKHSPPEMTPKTELTEAELLHIARLNGWVPWPTEN